MSAPRTVTVRGQERAPVDAVADRVTRGGVAYEPARNLGPQELGRDCPILREPPPLIADLRGQRSGRMAMVGYLETAKKKPSDYGKGGVPKQRWVARCDCGRYEIRAGDKWRRNMRNNKGDMCQECRRWSTKRKSEWGTP